MIENSDQLCKLEVHPVVPGEMASPIKSKAIRDGNQFSYRTLLAFQGRNNAQLVPCNIDVYRNTEGMIAQVGGASPDQSWHVSAVIGQ